MRRRVLWAFITVLFLQSAAVRVWAAEALAGDWRLEQQELNGQKQEHDPLTLRVTPEGDKYTFAFSVPVNGIYFVSMSYTVRLDGSEGAVKNARGEKIGTAQMTEPSPSHYKLTLHGQNRPESLGKLALSPDGKTLISESDTERSGQHMHLLQRFSRYN